MQVLIMRDGHLIYQGPGPHMVPYFEELGYRCPPSMDASDFVMEIASKDDSRHLIDWDENAEKGLSSLAPPTTTADLRARYEATSLWSAKDAAIRTTIAPRTTPLHEWKEEEAETYKNTWITSLLVCLHREWIFFTRDKSFLAARLFQNLVLGIATGTIFWNLPSTSYNDRYGVIFSIVLALGLKSMASIPVFYQQRSGIDMNDDYSSNSRSLQSSSQTLSSTHLPLPLLTRVCPPRFLAFCLIDTVYYKLHRARFFQPSAYALANLLVQSLYVAIDALTYGPILYWCSGFTSSGHTQYFWAFLLIIFTGGVSMGQFFRALVSSIRVYPLSQLFSFVV